MENNKQWLPRIVLILLAVTFVGCAPIVSKQEAFPQMYDPQIQPVSVLVVPAINESTNVDATDFWAATIAEPLTYLGYYVFPLEVVTEVLRNEGVVDTTQIRNLPAQAFAQGFGADAVLYVTITSWDKNYMIIAGNVEVGLEFVMVSTQTGETLWSYASIAIVDTSGSSGFILTDIIATAITTATTQNLPVAKQANAFALASLPVGSYHPEHGLDGEQKAVNTDLQAAALEVD